MKNWEKVKLGTLLTESKIISQNPNPDNRIRVKLNLMGIEKRPLTKDKKGATKYYIRKAGQFIYGKQNLHKGAFGIIPEELDGFESSLDIPAFDVDQSCYPEWIYYFFRKSDFYLNLENLAKGVGSKRIQPKQIFDLEIYLPTKKEQRKILDEIEKSKSNNQELLDEIQLQEVNLIKLRQAILQDAISGKLSEEWRKLNLGVEPANHLLKKIKAEKEGLIKQKKIKTEKKLHIITPDIIPFEIPENWVWCRMQNILKDIRYGTSKKCDYGLGDSPVLRIPNIKNGKIDLSDLKSTNLSVKELKDLSLEEGDLLIIRSNGSKNLVGRSAVIADIGVGYSFAGYLIRINIFKKFIDSSYIYSVLESPMTRMAIEFPLTTSSEVKNINSIEISKLVIPIPPLEEQKIIVTNISKLLSRCDEIEKEIFINKEISEKLIQSVLNELLGDENNILIKKNKIKNIKETTSREIKYNNKTVKMELVELLKINGRLHAEDLWRMSKHYNIENESESIDKFYTDLKEQIENEKKIREVVNEKGYLELS
ncbi:MAG: restriction endonuclease subunit S [Flavobacterium sp.]|mgnify:CR=1 FL=1|nr:restriction endonuclease subunit S [Flavobacterium sp.]